MHLRSLTIKGFKSFPNRTKLEFSPGVAVIRGSSYYVRPTGEEDGQTRTQRLSEKRRARR